MGIYLKLLAMNQNHTWKTQQPTYPIPQIKNQRNLVQITLEIKIKIK